MDLGPRPRPEREGPRLALLGMESMDHLTEKITYVDIYIYGVQRIYIDTDTVNTSCIPDRIKTLTLGDAVLTPQGFSATARALRPAMD